MALVWDPSPAWLLDNVLVLAEPGIDRIGPARSRQAAWFGLIADLARSAQDAATADALDFSGAQGLVLTTEQASSLGMSSACRRRLVRNGQWSAPRRGILCPLPPTPVPSDLPPVARSMQPHGLAAPILAAAAALARPGTNVSHESALTMHGLPILEVVARPTLTAKDIARTATKADALVRDGAVREQDRDEWFGTPNTGVERSIIDVARVSGVAAGLIAADAALYDSLTTLGKLRRTRNRNHYRPGIRNADRVIELASPLSESPLETLTRLCLIDGGLPPPELQVTIPTSRGVYRVDALYRRARVIVEADGLLKYRGADPLALYREKRRQEALEQAGFVVVRVSWWDVMNEPQEVVRRVRNALARRR